MLAYGADAEWRIFSRYEVLDNAIQKLAKYENNEQEIRANAIDEFTERIALEISESIIWGMLPTDCKDGVSDEIVDYVIDTSKKIAEQMKAGGIDG